MTNDTQACKYGAGFFFIQSGNPNESGQLAAQIERRRLENFTAYLDPITNLVMQSVISNPLLKKKKKNKN